MTCTPTEERFRERLVEGPEVRPGLGNCLECTGARHAFGYGVLQFGGKTILAHRYAWFLATGAWPTKSILHRCDNPRCVRLEHLFEGTQAENMRDCAAKKRHAFGVKNGHATLDDDWVRTIRVLRILGLTSEAISKRFELRSPSVRSIWNGQTWRHCYNPLFKPDDSANPRRYHGLSKLPEYIVWQGLRQGDVQACRGWLTSPRKFIADVGPRPSKLHEFWRVRTDDAFCCGDCAECRESGASRNGEWIKRKVNDYRNQVVTAWGETRSLAEWCELRNLQRYAIAQRLRYGWTPEAALGTPVRAKAPKGKSVWRERARERKREQKQLALAQERKTA